jgi:adenosylmethionine-8-amino-7-oxononanoate aminotransferase
LKSDPTALAQLDRRYLWHPFTQMRDWLRRDPIVIVDGKGAVLRDAAGREYLDANSSIWTNLHGHAHPKINAAIARQLKKISHSSALGLASEPASLLAQKLIESTSLASINSLSPRSGERARVRGSIAQNAPVSTSAPRKLERVFFSDNGSTAMEVALKLAYEFARRAGRSRNPRFLSLDSAYHGDTVGAGSLGHIDLFHRNFGGLLFQTGTAMSPYCYRCPFNRARPERADAREYRKCHWECVGKVEEKFVLHQKKGDPVTAFVFEPLIQGAAGMIPQPAGWLARVAEIARGHGAQLIADEVMTAFGRATSSAQSLLACHQENVHPDYAALAKGLSGGYLPLAATLTTLEVFEAFLGEYDEFKTFFHGHSFTGNQLGSAAALASLSLLQSPSCAAARQILENTLREELKILWPLPQIGDIRQVGLVAGVELVKNWKTREPFDLRDQAGVRVCEAMARRGVLTRPVGNVIVLMPPYCATKPQTQKIVRTLRQSIIETLGL